MKRVPIAKADKELFPEIEEVEVFPDRRYNSHQAAAILQLPGSRRSRLNALYKIEYDDLPWQMRGPGGRRREYIGRDLLNYRDRHG